MPRDRIVRFLPRDARMKIFAELAEHRDIAIATLELGSHPIADELRMLGFPRRALSTTWFGRWSATFDDAVILERSSPS